jgi:hypothetical protein
MKIEQKLDAFETALRSILEHDDASMEELKNALKRIRKMIENHERAALRRRGN